MGSRNLSKTAEKSSSSPCAAGVCLSLKPWCLLNPGPYGRGCIHKKKSTLKKKQRKFHVFFSKIRVWGPKISPRLVQTLLPWTAGSLFSFPATSVSRTLLRALRNLMHGAKNWFVPGLRATSRSSINSTATWMCHVLGPHVSCDEC
jgi:hypothetical protein